MKLSHVVVPLLLVAGRAFAQAPGDTQDSDAIAPPGGAGDAPVVSGEAQVDVAPPGMAPVVAPPPQQLPPPPPPREQRWSVSLGLGELTLAPHNSPDDKAEFGLGMLAVRWRPFRHLELELAFGGGNEKAKDGMDSGRDVSEALLGLRWRFNPHKKWNLWVMGGIGTITVAPSGATQEERNALHQSTLQFGGGLERKWHHFAIAAELRAVGVAPIDGTGGDKPPVMGTVSSTGAQQPPNTTTTTPARVDGWSGGQLLISGNYYF